MHFPPFPCPRPQQSCHQGVRLPRLIHLPQRVVRAKHQPETRVGPGLGRVGCVSATQPSRRSTDDKLARHVTPNQESLTGGERERERGRGSAADFHSPITRTLSLSLSLRKVGVLRRRHPSPTAPRFACWAAVHTRTLSVAYAHTPIRTQNDHSCVSHPHLQPGNANSESQKT